MIYFNLKLFIIYHLIFIADISIVSKAPCSDNLVLKNRKSLGIDIPCGNWMKWKLFQSTDSLVSIDISSGYRY